MTIDLHDTLDTLAGRAPEPPADLAERVETRHARRRRNRMATTAAFVAVLVAASGAWAVWRPTAADPAPTAAFHLPYRPGNVPPATATWPTALADGPLPAAPGGGNTSIVAGRLDRDHLLVWSGQTVKPNGTLWRYAPRNRSYRALVTGIPGPIVPGQTVITKQSIIYVTKQQGTKLWAAPRVGGPARQLATDGNIALGTFFWADDRYLYSSVQRPEPSARVLRVPLAGGALEPVPGFEGLFTDGTAWARNREGTIFRHLSTGEERRVVRPGGTVRFDCVPSFCLGEDRAGWFVQRLDGSARTKVPYPGGARLLGDFGAGDSGLIMVGGGILVDPVRGRHGQVTREPFCGLTRRPWYPVPTAQSFDDVLTVQWQPMDGSKCLTDAPPRNLYLSAID